MDTTKLGKYDKQLDTVYQCYIYLVLQIQIRFCGNMPLNMHDFTSGSQVHQSAKRD